VGHYIKFRSLTTFAGSPGSRKAWIMPTISRLSGRFFYIFLPITLALAFCPSVAVGEAAPLPPPPASPSARTQAALTAAHPFATPGSSLPSSAAQRFTLPVLEGPAALLAEAMNAHPQPSPFGMSAAFASLKGQSAPAPTLCQITDTVYRADGTPAQGTALISWPAFTTAAGQAVAPGSLTVTLDASGGFNASLAPNTGASPAGTYYRAIFKLDDGTTDSEYWVVPNSPSTTIGAIRSKLVPAGQAAQLLTRDFADSTYVSLASTQTITGAKTFSSSPAVPTPQNPTDAANKAYVDANSGSANLASPPPIGSTTPNTVSATVLTSQDARTANFPVMDLRDYGLVGDGAILANCNIASGQKVVTCSGSAFTSADAGKGAFFQGAGAAGAYLNTTIASYQSATQVTLAAAASTTVAGGTLFYGTDNTAAWCAAMNCASANVPNALFTVQPGRTVRLPRGTYFLTGSAYTRNGDQLVGDGYTGTEVMLFDPTGNIHLLYMGSNASAGANTGTIDSGGLDNRVSGILFATPEAAPGYCIDTNGYSGWDIDHNWFMCGVGIFVNHSNIGRVTANTCDSSTAQCMIVQGSGTDYVSDPTHSLLISGNMCYATHYSCVQFDGAAGVNFVNNVLDYAKQFSLYVYSAAGNTSYRLNISGNIFTTSLGSSYYTPTQQHIAVLGPLVRSTIGPNNIFSKSQDADILVTTAVWLVLISVTTTSTAGN
jgi:hypothetical protein